MDDRSETVPPAPSPAPSAKRPNVGYLLIGMLLVAVVGGAYWIKSRPNQMDATGPGSQEALMKAGLDTLYTKGDPNAAARQFRKVLAVNPTHYGATFQLAKALDSAGKPDEARPYWEKMLTMAEAAKDDTTIATVRGRLKQPTESTGDTSQATSMKAGLDSLYSRNDPNAAAEEFRKVLALNPTHYGATFQLAMALDRAGKASEGRPLWEKVLKMAEGYKDQATVDAARTRLARNP